jgi:hypothetical protein
MQYFCDFCGILGRLVINSTVPSLHGWACNLLKSKLIIAVAEEFFVLIYRKHTSRKEPLIWVRHMQHVMHCDAPVEGSFLYFNYSFQVGHLCTLIIS